MIHFEESGGHGAISLTIQTENIGFEKVVCNVVANPNIRYMIAGGPESEGHLTGEALKALIGSGVDEKMRIRDTDAPHPLIIFLCFGPALVLKSKFVSTTNNFQLVLTQLGRRFRWKPFF